MLGREKLDVNKLVYATDIDTMLVDCEGTEVWPQNGDGNEYYFKTQADNVMDAMERRIARLFNLVAGYQRNSLGLSAMYNRRLDSELERIAELESQLSKWISVKERVPKEGELVLAMRPKAFKYKMDVIAWSCDYYSNDATHWMPLPQPPTTYEKAMRVRFENFLHEKCEK